MGFDPVFGARPLKRAIQQRIENPLSKLLLEGRFPPKSVIPVDVDPVFGARPLKRAIQQRIENPLSKLLLEGRFPPKSRIEVSVDPVLEPGVFHFGASAPV